MGVASMIRMFTRPDSARQTTVFSSCRKSNALTPEDFSDGLRDVPTAELDAYNQGKIGAG